MNFGPSWLCNNPTMTSYDQSEMLSMCHDLQKPADPQKFRMLLNTEPSLPLALHAEPVDQEAAVHPEVITVFIQTFIDQYATFLRSFNVKMSLSCKLVNIN